MADTEINGLTAIAALALGDVEHVNDVSSANVSRKATKQQFVDLLNASALLDAGAINADAVTTVKILNANVTTAKIADANVTLAKQADLAQDRIIGRITASTGVPEALTAANVLTMISVESGADVTDETNVVASLDGATIADITVAATDKILLQDVSDSDALKTETAQGVADLSSTKGKHTIWVPAGTMTPSTTAGCATLATVETTAGRPDFSALDFDPSTEEHAQFTISFPKSWNEGTITFQPVWTRTATPTAGLDGVVWGLQGLCVADDASIDQAYGTEVVVGLDAAKTAEDIWMSAESGAVTITGAAVDTVCFLQISRVVGSTTPLDDMDVDARFLGVRVFYTTDAETDN